MPRALRVLTVLAGPCLALFLTSPLTLAQNQATQAELDALNEAISKAQAGLRQTRSQQSEASRALEASERRLAELERRMGEVQQSLSQEQERLDSLLQQQGSLLTEKSSQEAQVAAYLRAAWQRGGSEALTLLLNQENPAESARALRYYQYFSAARTEKIARFRQTLAELDSLRLDIEASQAHLSEQQERLNDQRDEQLDEQKERQALLERLNNELADRGAELARLEEERIALSELLEELRRAAARDNTGQPFAERRGQLPWPVEGQVLNRFGSRQSGDLNWQGINIGAEAGAAVRAVHSGRVVYADWFRSQGLLLIIDHGDGYMTLYAQNQQLSREMGDWVNAGEVIGTAGTTGGRREPGLYFELRHNGRSQDPALWLRRD